jgi:hypothetical protein
VSSDRKSGLGDVVLERAQALNAASNVADAYASLVQALRMLSVALTSEVALAPAVARGLVDIICAAATATRQCVAAVAGAGAGGVPAAGGASMLRDPCDVLVGCVQIAGRVAVLGSVHGKPPGPADRYLTEVPTEGAAPNTCDIARVIDLTVGAVAAGVRPHTIVADLAACSGFVETLGKALKQVHGINAADAVAPSLVLLHSDAPRHLASLFWSGLGVDASLRSTPALVLLRKALLGISSMARGCLPAIMARSPLPAPTVLRNTVAASLAASVDPLKGEIVASATPPCDLVPTLAAVVEASLGAMAAGVLKREPLVSFSLDALRLLLDDRATVPSVPMAYMLREFLVAAEVRRAVHSLRPRVAVFVSLQLSFFAELLVVVVFFWCWWWWQ